MHFSTLQDNVFRTGLPEDNVECQKSFNEAFRMHSTPLNLWSIIGSLSQAVTDVRAMYHNQIKYLHFDVGH